MNKPDPPVVSAILEYLLCRVVKGEVSRKVVIHLFSMYGSQERICANDVSENGGPQGDGNVAAFMSRFRELLVDHYDYDEDGRKQLNRVAFIDGDRGNYSIVIEPNTPPTGFLPGFWRHYLLPATAILVYPEQNCSCSHTHQDFEDDGEVGEDDTESADFDYRTKIADPSPSRGFISACHVRSIFRLIGCFRTWDVALGATAIHPLAGMPDGDLIVLATPQSAPRLLAALEATAYIKTGIDGVTVNGIKDPKKREYFTDTRENSRTKNGTALVKYVVVTRHHYRYQQTLTVIAALDELAIEAVVQVLTTENAMLSLAKALKFKDSFPDHFQALFAVRMVKGHRFARHITVERTIDLGSPQ